MQEHDVSGVFDECQHSLAILRQRDPSNSPKNR